MKAAVIINPIAGTGRKGDARSKVELARHHLEAQGLSGKVFVTERPGHAGEIARDAATRDVSLVVAWGGDGTINEVLPALAHRNISLGIVPGGSGNGLARELGLDRRPERALVTAIAGRDRRIDVGELGGRMFVNVAGIGFDAHVALLFNARAIRGPLGYFTTTIRELISYAAAEYEMTVDGKTLRRRALVIALANSRQYGTGACIAPEARLGDGSLRLVVIEDRNVIASLWEARRLFLSTMHRGRGILTRKFQSLSVSSTEGICFHVDGEAIHGPTRLTARVHPDCLSVRV